MISNNDENLYSKTYKKNCSKTEKVLIFTKTLSKLKVDPFRPQGGAKTVSRQKNEF